MARKLPWATDASAENVKPANRHKKPVAPKKESRQDVSRPTTPEPSTPRKARRAATSRSPSSSPMKPPAQAAPQIEPMRPGLSRDDKYIMVEDEFESVARQFTAHLHAAEYARLKAKARAAPPRTLPSPTSNMRRTTARGLERRQINSRQGTTLSGFVNGAKKSAGEHGQGQGGGSDVDDDEAIGDPWSGTSLAGLMDGDERTKTSLIGLQRINAGTRAARGYEKPNSQPEVGLKRKRTLAEIFGDDVGWIDDDDGDGNTGGGNRRRVGDKLRHRLGSADNSEDVFTKATEQSGMSASTSKKAETYKQNRVTDHQSDTVTVADPRSHHQHPPSRIHVEDGPRPRRNHFIDFDDDFDTLVTASSSADFKRGHGTESPNISPDVIKGKGKEREKAKDRKARLDEVPMFLV